MFIPGNILACKSEQVTLSKCVLESSKLNAFECKMMSQRTFITEYGKTTRKLLKQKRYKGLREMS